MCLLTQQGSTECGCGAGAVPGAEHRVVNVACSPCPLGGLPFGGDSCVKHVAWCPVNGKGSECDSSYGDYDDIYDFL